MKSSIDTSIFSDYADFCGNHQLNFDSINEQKVEQLVTAVSQGVPYPRLLDIFANDVTILERIKRLFNGIANKFPFYKLRDIMTNDVDQLALSAIYAFSKGKITREQTGTLLEFCEIRMAFGNDVVVGNLLDPNETAFAEHPEFGGAYCFLNQTFLAELRKKPASECYAYLIKIPREDVNTLNLLALAEKAGLLHMHKKESAEGVDFYITYFSLGARDALAKARFGEHAKKLYPRLGIFSIYDIQRSIKNYGRYAATYCPGISSGDNFHQVLARLFYLLLHDEIHRTLISSIPNPLYAALLYAIDVVCEKTGIKMAKDIWDNIDMEIRIFIDNYPDISDDICLNENFSRLLNANIATQFTPINLFKASPLCDTTWLILIDMILNPNKWDAWIHPHLFIHAYQDMIDLIKRHQAALRQETSPARQVAYIKSKYFNIPEPAPDDDVQFVKNKKVHGSVQVNVNHSPILANKNDAKLYYGYEYLIQYLPERNEKEVAKLYENLKFVATQVGLKNQFPSAIDFLKENKIETALEASVLDELRNNKDLNRLLANKKIKLDNNHFHHVLFSLFPFIKNDLVIHLLLKDQLRIDELNDTHLHPDLLNFVLQTEGNTEVILLRLAQWIAEMLITPETYNKKCEYRDLISDLISSNKLTISDIFDKDIEQWIIGLRDGPTLRAIQLNKLTIAELKNSHPESVENLNQQTKQRDNTSLPPLGNFGIFPPKTKDSGTDNNLTIDRKMGVSQGF